MSFDPKLPWIAFATCHAPSARNATTENHRTSAPNGVLAIVLSAPDWSACSPPFPNATRRASTPIRMCSTPLTAYPARAASSQDRCAFAVPLVVTARHLLASGPRR